MPGKIATSMKGDPPDGCGAPHRPSSMGDLIDALVENAATLVRQRAILPGLNWRQASPAQVVRLGQRLDEGGVAIPPWLARDLLSAGHKLPPGMTAQLPPDAAVLAKLLEADELAPVPEALRQAVIDLAYGPALDAAVSKALASHLVARGEDQLAAQFALGQWPRSDVAWRAAKPNASRHIASLPQVHIHIAGFSTAELFAGALIPAVAAHGFQAVVSAAAYGTALAELMRPSVSAEARFIVLDTEAVLGVDWRGGLGQARQHVEQRINDICAAVATHAQHSQTPLYINTLPAVVAPALGHADQAHDAGAAAMVRRANTRLAELPVTWSNVHLVDTDVALADIAPRRRIDAKLWYYGRIAYSEDAYRHLASAFASAWQAHKRAPVKVLALDFDNTLWGGVFGDDGVDALACGDDFPGNAFKAFQQEAMRLKSQGLLLVGLSKNNADAIEVFERHPGMALRAGDFAATAINWEPKPDNIRRLAAELNLGLDSFLFLDDSPHERTAMRRMCPQVRVPELPADPAERPLWLRSLVSTWPIRVTEEDSKRSEMYAAERKAQALRETAASYDEYLDGLGQTLLVATVDRPTLSRVAQLHERTNQFNLTTRRFSEAELVAFLADPTNNLVLQGEAADRFGHYGIVVAAVARVEGATARIESFLMSCRVMSRTIETAFLGALLEQLSALGVERVEAAYFPTAKNGMVREFYGANGFEPGGPAADGDLWIWRTGAKPIPATPFVTVRWRDQ